MKNQAPMQSIMCAFKKTNIFYQILGQIFITKHLQKIIFQIKYKTLYIFIYVS